MLWIVTSRPLAIICSEPAVVSQELRAEAGEFVDWNLVDRSCPITMCTNHHRRSGVVVSPPQGFLAQLGDVVYARLRWKPVEVEDLVEVQLSWNADRDRFESTEAWLGRTVYVVPLPNGFESMISAQFAEIVLLNH